MIVEMERPMATSEEHSEERKLKMQQFGAELRRRRISCGYKTGVEFAEAIKMSDTSLSDLERAYAKPGKLPTTPDIATINTISSLLDWPKVDMLKTMGYLDEADLERDAQRDPNNRRLESFEDFHRKYNWLTKEQAELHWKSILSSMPQESTNSY